MNGDGPSAMDMILERAHQRALDAQVRHDIPKDIRALPLLGMVYRGEIELTPQQFRAACEALPYENPRLGAVATTSMSGQDFASLLEKAIRRSELGKPLRLIEGSKTQT